MLPLWIIDLESSAVSKKKLQSLLGAMGENMKSYWHYFHVEEDMAVEGIDSCKALMDALVNDGRNCYNAFSKAGYRVSNFQILVLGAADERLSQSIFAPLAGLLRDSLPRIIADHANLGVEITGVLYVPSTINQCDDVSKRRSTAMLLEEVNMLNERLGSRHYSYMVAYQDIQYKGIRFYSALSPEQRTELLFQIVTNLFFSSVDRERVFDRINQYGCIFSVGVASVYYNSKQHQDYELKKMLDRLVAEFKDTENADGECSRKIVKEMFDGSALTADAVSERLCEGCGSLDIDLNKIDGEPDPHPVWDLFLADLFPRYYRRYLKYMPARLIRFMQSFCYVLLARFSDVIRRNREEAVGHFKTLLDGIYRKVYLDPAVSYATIAQVEATYNAVKDLLLAKRKEVTLALTEIVPVPKYLRNDYDRCVADEEANTPSAIIDDIRKNLKKEPVVLSLLVRCFLLGILLVFTIVPVLRVLSPHVINLGGIVTIEWLWIPVLFFLPLVIEFFIKLRRHFKRIRRLKYKLLACNLLSVNKRLSKFLMDEQGAFYDALIEECNAQLKLLSAFRDALHVADVKKVDGAIPENMFNQPLLGGSFCGEQLLADESVTEAKIRVDGKMFRVSELMKDDIVRLLKESFRQSETQEAADLSDKDEPTMHAESFVAVLGNRFMGQLDIQCADNMGKMLNLLEKNFNLDVFKKMAGVNGMLFSVNSSNKPIVKVVNSPKQFEVEGMSIIGDEKTSDYAMMTCWQRIDSPGILSQQVCNYDLNPLPELSFADKLSLYYGYYRQNDLAFRLAGQPIRIPKEDMVSFNNLKAE